LQKISPIPTEQQAKKKAPSSLSLSLVKQSIAIPNDSARRKNNFKSSESLSISVHSKIVKHNPVVAPLSSSKASKLQFLPEQFSPHYVSFSTSLIIG
jgi:hypothetical protein